MMVMGEQSHMKTYQETGYCYCNHRNKKIFSQFKPTPAFLSRFIITWQPLHTYGNKISGVNVWVGTLR